MSYNSFTEKSQQKKILEIVSLARYYRFTRSII